MLPIWFLIFCMHVKLIISPDFNSYAQGFVAWVLTGLAGLIILLTVKIGSSQDQDGRTGTAREPGESGPYTSPILLR